MGLVVVSAPERLLLCSDVYDTNGGLPSHQTTIINTMILSPQTDCETLTLHKQPIDAVRGSSLCIRPVFLPSVSLPPVRRPAAYEPLEAVDVIVRRESDDESSDM